MKPALSNNERQFMLAAAREGYRLDGRKLEAPRPVKYTFGLTPGNAEVQLGGTRVLASITSELTSPLGGRPQQGILAFTTKFPSHAPVTRSAVDRVTLVVERAIKRTHAVDLESLCVLMGEKVWKLHVDLCVIQDDGAYIPYPCKEHHTSSRKASGNSQVRE